MGVGRRYLEFAASGLLGDYLQTGSSKIVTLPDLGEIPSELVTYLLGLSSKDKPKRERINQTVMSVARKAVGLNQERLLEFALLYLQRLRGLSLDWDTAEEPQVHPHNWISQRPDPPQSPACNVFDTVDMSSGMPFSATGHAPVCPIVGGS